MMFRYLDRVTVVLGPRDDPFATAELDFGATLLEVEEDLGVDSGDATGARFVSQQTHSTRGALTSVEPAFKGRDEDRPVQARCFFPDQLAHETSMARARHDSDFVFIMKPGLPLRQEVRASAVPHPGEPKSAWRRCR